MKKRTPILVGLSLIISLSIVFALHLGANKNMNYRFNSFSRNIANNVLTMTDTLNIKHDSYYFSGATSSRIYLSNHYGFADLIVLNPDLTKIDRIQIKIDSLKYRSVQVAIDSPYFYLSDGTVPFIYRGSFSDWNASLYLDSIYFITAHPISKESLALIALNNMENTLEKKTSKNPKVQIFRDLLEEQVEGIFSTDGKLNYDKKTARMTFVYYYRNQYICMDTNFNLLFRGNTIDTISQAKIKAGEISSENSFTMSAPPLVVNKKSCVSGNSLYINSNLLAKNEDVKVFEKESVIDVYDLESRDYKYSFYIPPYKGHRLNEFIVIDNKTLISLHGKYVVTYKILKEDMI